MVFITKQYGKGRESCHVSLTQTIQFLTGTLLSIAEKKFQRTVRFSKIQSYV